MAALALNKISRIANLATRSFGSPAITEMKDLCNLLETSLCKNLLVTFINMTEARNHFQCVYHLAIMFYYIKKTLMSGSYLSTL